MTKWANIYAHTVLILISIFLGCITEAKVNWTTAKKLIVLGSDLQLDCHVTGVDRNNNSALKRWTGGSDDHDICTKKKCIKEDKYEMQYDPSNPTFNLIIKNVDEIDIKERFTCWYNFESSSGTIISQNNSIIIDQTGINKQTSNYSIDGNFLDINITLGKVYPVPNCDGTLEYKDKFIVYWNKSLITRSSKLPSGLYQAEVNGTLEFPLITSCNRVLKITCNFGSVPITIFAKNSTQCGRQDSTCSKEANDSYVIFMILSAVVSVLFVLVGLVFIIFCKYFYTERKQYNLYMALQKEETHDEENQQVHGTMGNKQYGNNKRMSKTIRRRKKGHRRHTSYP